MTLLFNMPVRSVFVCYYKQRRGVTTLYISTPHPLLLGRKKEVGEGGIDRGWNEPR